MPLFIESINPYFFKPNLLSKNFSEETVTSINKMLGSADNSLADVPRLVLGIHSKLDESKSSESQSGFLDPTNTFREIEKFVMNCQQIIDNLNKMLRESFYVNSASTARILEYIILWKQIRDQITSDLIKKQIPNDFVPNDIKDIIAEYCLEI